MEDLTTGPLSRHLMKTASFMLVTMVFQTLYFLVDLYWVGRLGKEAVAAVAIAGNLMFVVLAASQMLGVGTTAMVSHAVGRKDRDTAQRIFNQSQVLSLGAGLIFFALVMAARGAYARLLAADAVTADAARSYLTWFVPAMSMQFALVAMGAALRGTGNFKPGMVVQTATVIVNIVLAPVLMFGWGTGRPMGVAGTAMASFVAVVIGVAWLATYFLPRDAYLHINASGLTPDFDLWKRLLTIGLPAGAEFALLAVYLLIVYVVSRPFGAAAQAGFGIGLRIVQALFMPVVALGFAVAPVAGQNFGARKSSRVRQTFRDGALMASSVMLLAGLLCNWIPAPLIAIFSSDAQVIAVGAEYLRISSWNFIASGIIFVASSMFQAMGNTVPALAASALRIVLVAIPVFMISRTAGFELRWIWYISVTAAFIQMTASLLLLRREFRLRLVPLDELGSPRAGRGVEA